MSDEAILRLEKGEKGDALGLAVTFSDSGKLDYANRPSAGFIVLDLEAGGETEQIVAAQRNWGSPEEWNGFEITVLNEPEIAPPRAVVRVRRL